MASTNETTRSQAARCTPHQIETLRAVLANGGAWAREGHMGRISARRPFRTTTLERLEERGLLEAVTVEDPTKAKHAGKVLKYFPRPTCSIRYFVTALGCAILQEAEAFGWK